jgi:hypothetical protein
MPRTALTFEDVARLGLALPGTERSTSYGSPSLKVKGRMYACIAINKQAEPNSLVFRIPANRRNELLEEDPKTFYLKPHYQDYSCLLARLGVVSERTLAGLLAESHAFMAAGGRVVAARKRKR